MSERMDELKPDHKAMAAHIRLFPSAYSMAAHDTNVCNFSADELERFNCQIKELTTAIVAKNGEIGGLRGLLGAAKCPNFDCKDGVILQHNIDDEFDPEQCQWCAERQATLP